MPITAEAMIFSGMPNPRAELTSADEATVRERFGRAKSQHKSVGPRLDQPDHTGVVVRLDESHAFRAKHGVIDEFLPDGTVISFVDSTQLEEVIQGCLSRLVPSINEFWRARR